MIALALMTVLAIQDTNTTLSPRVRAMLDRFPLPRGGEPSVAIRFSRDTVWVGEQVELVTAAWFPRRLRDRLRRQPTIKAPSLSGLWSARNQMLPIPAEARVIGNQMYDLFVSYQTIFPLGPGKIEAPPAVLTYDVPTSTSYFAPEERRTIVSTSVRLVARGVPPASAAALGAGPTAHDLRLTWRAPAGGLRVGSPSIMELAISGSGNLTLWPAPPIVWPPGVHVYPEPTEEHTVPVQGVIAGEKRFRFTVVVDSAGVLTLPAVSYPYFDPVGGKVEPAMAAAMSLPVRPAIAARAGRHPPPITRGLGVPVSTRVVRVGWPVMIALALFPPLVGGWRRRRRHDRVAAAPVGSDPEAALRAALGTPVEAGPDHVVAALRQRGIPRDEAEHVLRWLSAIGRRRYGPTQTAAPEAPPVVTQVLARLRRSAPALVLLVAVLAPLRAAQQDDGMARYAGGDYVGAARAFADTVRREPRAANAWLDLGAAHWMQGDDVVAAAAWLHALELAPRDRLLRDTWRDAITIPPDVRAMGPVIPVSLDDLAVIALLLWLALWLATWRRWFRAAWAIGALLSLVLALGVARFQAARPGRALVTANAVLRISPHPATDPIGELPVWSQVHIDRRAGDWVLVTAPQAVSSGATPSGVAAGWLPAELVAEINPPGIEIAAPPAQAR